MKEILEYLFTDRLKSYFYRSFIVTWLIINWKIVFTIFGFGLLEESEQKKGLIKAVKDSVGDNHNLVCYPLCYTLCFILLIPLIDLLITLFKKGVVNKLYYKIIYSGKIPFTGKDIKRKDKEYAELEEKYTKAETKSTEYEKKYTQEKENFDKYLKEHEYAKNWEMKPFNVFGGLEYYYEIKSNSNNVLGEKGILHFTDNNISISFKPNGEGNQYYYPKILSFKYINNKLEFVLWIGEGRSYKTQSINEEIILHKIFTLEINSTSLKGIIFCHWYNEHNKNFNVEEYRIILTQKN